MIAILVVYLGEQEEEWNCPPLVNYLKERILDFFSASGFESLWVLTDSIYVEHLANKMGVHDVILERNITADDTKALARAVGKRVGLHSPISLVFPQTPGAHAGLLGKMLEEYSADHSFPFISIAQPKDHPCQLQCLGEVVAGGMINLFDTESDFEGKLKKILSPKCLISKPFPFDWKLVDGANSEHIFFRGGLERLAPIRREEVSLEPLVWARQDADSARIVWPRGTACPQACGLSSSITPEVPIHLSSCDGMLHIHGTVVGEYRIKMMPFTPDGFMHENGPIDIPFTNNTPFLQYDDRFSGFAYTLMRYPRGEEYTHRESFAPDDGQVLEWAQMRKGGYEGYGRQAFPPIWHIVPGIFIGTAAQMEEIYSLLADGRIRGVQMDNGAFFVRNKVDYFRYIAEKKAANING